MKPSHGTVAVRIGAALGLTLILLGLGAAARTTLIEETAQAHMLVDDGQHALLANDPSKAVLAFERARLFAPRGDFVRAALLSAGVRDPEPLPSQVLGILAAPEWAAVAIVFGWLGGLGLAGAIARRQGGLLGGLALASACVFIVAMTALVSSNRSSLSVITAHDAEALVAPYAGAQSQGPLPPGNVVVLGSIHGPFIHVRRGDGLEGWVPAKSLESIASQAGGRG